MVNLNLPDNSKIMPGKTHGVDGPDKITFNIYRWNRDDNDDIVGYKIYWRETTSHVWEYEKKINKKNFYVLKDIIIDNYLFGVSSINKKGFESIQKFPTGIFR